VAVIDEVNMVTILAVKEDAASPRGFDVKDNALGFAQLAPCMQTW
jgi:hypothetical protein